MKASKAGALIASAMALFVLASASAGGGGMRAGGGDWTEVAVSFAPGTERDFPALVAEHIGAELVSAEDEGGRVRAVFRVPVSRLDVYALFFCVVPYASLDDAGLRQQGRALAAELRAEADRPRPVGLVLHDSLTVQFREKQPDTLAAFDAVFGVSTAWPPFLTAALVRVPEGSAFVYRPLLELSPYVELVSLTGGVTLF